MYLGFKNQPSTFSPLSPWLTPGKARASKTVVVIFCGLLNSTCFVDEKVTMVASDS